MEARSCKGFHSSNRRKMVEIPEPVVITEHHHAHTHMQLNKVVSLFNDLRRQQSAFTDQIDQWKMTRQMSIRVIGEIKEKLDSVHTCSEVAQCVGMAATIIGGIIGFAGEFTEDRERRQELRKCGMTIGAIGGVGTVAAKSIEFFVSETFINSAKFIVEEDQELLRPILETLQISRDIDSIFEDLFNCSIASSEFTSIMQAFKVMSSSVEGLANKMEGVVESYVAGKFVNMESIAQELGERTYEVLKATCIIPSLKRCMSQIYDFVSKNPLLMEFSVVCLRKVEESLIRAGGEAFGQIMKSLFTLSGRGMLSASGVRGMFLAVNAARDAVALVSKIKDLCEGKTSEYSDLLVKVRAALQHELDILSGTMQQRIATRRLLPAVTYN